MLSLNVPEDVYNRALRIAEETSQPVEQILLDHLRRLPDAYPGLPNDEQEEIFHPIRGELQLRCDLEDCHTNTIEGM